jgi:homoserine O-acetyltransferase
MANGWLDGSHQVIHLGDMPLESGQILKDARLSYVIHGQINSGGSNVILALPAIGSTHHRLDFLIGSGRALDTDRWCIICTDTWGNGLASSPSNSQTQPLWKFPIFSVRDMVQGQSRLLDALGVSQLAAVVGASMGGMQALQWAVSFPQRMRKVIAITPMAKTTPWAQAVNEISRQILGLEPGKDGQVDPQRWRAWSGLMQGLAGRSPAAFDRMFSQPGQVHEFLQSQAQAHLRTGMHPIDWWYQTLAYDAHDLGTTAGFAGNTLQALQSIQADTLVLGPTLDLYNPATAWQWLVQQIPHAQGVVIPSDMGHQSASNVMPEDTAFLDAQIRPWLNG